MQVSQYSCNEDRLCGSVMMLGGGRSQLFLCKALVELNISFLLIDRDDLCPCRVLCDYFIRGSTHDESSWIDELLALHDTLDIEYILVASSGPAVQVASRIAKKLGIMLYGEEAASIANSKISFRKYFDSLLLQDDSICDRLEFNSWPKVIRAESSIEGKESVRSARCQADLALMVSEIKEKSLTGRVIIEPYVDGSDYIICAFVRNSKVAALYTLVEVNEFLGDGRLRARGIFSLAEVPEKITNFSEGLLRRIIKDFQIINSPVALSIRCNDIGCMPIELHLDFGGESVFDILAKGCYPEGIYSFLKIIFGIQPVVRKSNFGQNCFAVVYNEIPKFLKSEERKNIIILDVNDRGTFIKGSQEQVRTILLRKM
jgi:hypothetical protein